MKSHSLFFFLALLIGLQVTRSFGQLSGTAYLANQSTHSGIKIKFTAASGTAVSDSCLTGPTGTYSISISGGLYYVTLSKSGYQSVMYNNSTPIALSNSMTLSTVTLAAGTASYVSGTVSGVWAGNIVYMVSGDLNVPLGSVLTIQPGAEVRFLGSYSLTVDGSINATGTQVSPIKFLPSVTTATWSGIKLNGGPSVLDFCEVRNAYAVETVSSTARISNCLIADSPMMGIVVSGGTATIENNSLLNNKLTGIGGYFDGGGLSCNKISSPLYKNSSNINRGINVNGAGKIFDNEVWDCQEGIYIHSFSSIETLANNYIHDNILGINATANNSPTLEIINNTFHHNRISVYVNHPGIILSNNVITSSTIAVQGYSLTCDHNLFYGCSTNFSLSSAVPGLGQVVNNNTNGDPIDSYYNLFIDPDYGTMMPSFEAGSPVVNAGNAAYDLNIGADVSSNCFVSLTLGVAENAAVPVIVFPNPSFGLFRIAMPGAVKVRVFTSSGSEILSAEAGENAITVNIANQPPGIYFCEVSGKNGRRLVKLVNL